MTANKSCGKAEREIIEKVRGKTFTKRELYTIKKGACEKYGVNRIITDSELFKKSRLSVFSRKPTRMLSGVSVIAVMTSPAKCPHGKCVFCPGGVDFNTPQSYTGKEPAALRAGENEYDAYKQVKYRLRQYESIGHNPSKVELIVMGGTFTHRPFSYQKKFIAGCLAALNGRRSGKLEAMQKLNETAKHRCVGLTVETRPDEINGKTIKRLLVLGVTRVELGVQSVYDKVLKASNRGHTVKDTVKATKLLKDSGFKINYHLMTNMPESSPSTDYSSFKLVFADKRFLPDMVKIYPTLLVKGTKLYDDYLKGKWVPYSEKETIKLIAKVKRIIPPYVRVMRIQRDIPSYLIEQDLKSSNLRQLVKNYMAGKGWVCRCVRCREGGRNKGEIRKARIRVLTYEASKGKEFFVEYSDTKGILFGFARCRKTKDTLFLRELHVYGEEVPVGEKGLMQHTGIGRLLLKRVEDLAVKEKAGKILVISGVGVRGYYEKFGYALYNSYMAKFL